MTNARLSRSALDSVLAVRVTDRTGILVRGKDRIAWLNGLVTCNLAKSGADDAAYGLLVEKKGRIQTDFFGLPSAAGDAFVLAVPKDLRDGVLETLDHYLIMEDAELEAVELAVVHLVGPKARELARSVEAPFAGAFDLYGPEGAIVATLAGEAPAFEQRLAARVEALGGSACDDAAFEPIRIERGVPRFGVEVDTTLYPQEAALEKVAVSFDKGCYLGQEVIYMLENRGHAKKKLVPLDLEGDAPVAPGDAVTTPDGTSAGEVKSAAIGPSTGRPVALAMIKWAQTTPGTELRVGDRVARVRG